MAYKIMQGQLPRNPSRWRVEVFYDVTNLEPGERNPRRLKFRVEAPCWMTELAELITKELNQDAADCGGVDNIKWIARQDR